MNKLTKLLETFFRKNEFTKVKEFSEKYKDRTVLYKNHVRSTLVGYTGTWILLGFNDNYGCVKEFSDHIQYIKGFKSYRFAKLKDVKPFIS